MNVDKSVRSDANDLAVLHLSILYFFLDIAEILVELTRRKYQQLHISKLRNNKH